MFQRTLQLPDKTQFSYFLWGSRQTGKSTLLKQTYPNALKIDLLKTDLYLAYHHNPALLREHVRQHPNTGIVIIDEIQKVPMLLEEVHFLIEEHGYKFALCGSSARKLRHGHANLLGGRAAKYELFGITAHEFMGEEIRDIAFLQYINIGTLPAHLTSSEPRFFMKSYVEDYLKEEIANEALVRNLGAFTEFLRISAIGDTEFVHYTNIARECMVSSPTVKEYYQILCDTLLGTFVRPFTLRPKRTTTLMEKFYFKNVGVVNFLAKRGNLEFGGELFGKAFENWLYNELAAYSNYRKKFEEIAYWRTKSGIEVDFIVGNALVAIESKAASVVTKNHLKGLQAFAQEYPETKRRIVVSLSEHNRTTDDGIEILNYKTFIKKLWNDEIF